MLRKLITYSMYSIFLLFFIGLSCSKEKSSLNLTNSENKVSFEDANYSSDDAFKNCNDLNSKKIKMEITHESVKDLYDYELIVKINYKVFYKDSFSNKIDIIIPNCMDDSFFFKFFLVKGESVYKWQNKDIYNLAEKKHIKVILWEHANFVKDIAREFSIDIK